MFSTHLPKANTVPRDYIYLGMGLLLIVGMLIAIASVASGQVKKAQMRDWLQASQRSAVANCVETTRGAALNNCIQQAQADYYAADMTTVAGNSAVFARTGGAAPNGSAGFMSVAFSSHR